MLECITEEEYTAFFDLLMSARNTFEEDFSQMDPKEDVKLNLSQAFQNKHKKSSFRLPIMDFSFRNPALYKFAFIFGVFVILSAFFFLNQKAVQPTHTISRNTPVKEKQSTPTIIRPQSHPQKEVPEPIQLAKEHVANKETPSIEYIDSEAFLMSTIRIIPMETAEFGSTDLNEQNTEINLEDFLRYTTPIRMDESNSGY